MRPLFLLLSFSFACDFLSAQPGNEYDKLINVVVPKGPEAAAYQRYGDIPVDYATGVPSISFPLYTVNAGNINLPITLSYHASGIRVMDVASCVGLGFTLNAGGKINHTIIDKDDIGGNQPLNFRTPAEYEAAKNTAIQTSASAADEKLSDLATKLWNDKIYGDRMSDRYNLFLPNGKSVVFRKNFSSGVFEQIPFENLKIEFINDKFKITDADGTIYRFENIDDDGWNLTRIEGQGVNNFIELTYGATQFNSLIGQPVFMEESGQWVNSSYYQNGSGAQCWSGSTGPGITLINQYYAGGQQSARLNNLVTKISNSDVEIIFTYGNGRSDPGTAKLEEIKVIDKHSIQQIKKILFNYSNFGNTADKTWRLKLNSFSFLPNGGTGAINETYSFGYNEDVILPPYFDINYHHLYHEDFWGYYNGTSALRNIPLEIVKNSSNGNDRYPNPGFSKACSLKEVTYPTGGKTVYELENNYGMSYEYPFLVNAPTGIGYGGGLRVKSIKNYAANGQLSSTKTYEYDGVSQKSINSNLFSYDKRIVLALNPYLIGYEMNRTFAVSEPSESFSIGGNPSVIYKVKEFLGTPADNTGYNVYDYVLPPRQEDNAYEFPNLSMKHAWQWDYGQEAPLLNNVWTYKKDAADPSGYTLVRNETYEYTALKQRKFSTGINIVQATSYMAHDIYWIELSGQISNAATSQNFSWCLIAGPDPFTQAPSANLFFASGNIFAVETSGYVASHLLTKKTEFVLSNSSYITNVTNYVYDPSTILLKSQTTTNSKGEILKTELSYPPDFVSQAPYNTMVSRNIITPVIEQSAFKNTSFLQSKKTNYGYWNGSAWSTSPTDIIVPKTVESKALSNNPETRIQFHSYDNKGNVLSVSKENDIKSSFIWGYNKQYPIAQVINADIKDIFHTSFEEGDGNSTVGDSKTGNKSKTNGLSTTLSNLTYGNYILSYWQKSGSNWTFQTNSIIVTNGGYSINLTGQIDEVRFYPEKAMMTTYTYAPLIGITSQCDANNRISYYEYDAFNRLILVRDKDNNILKKICYNYTGQPETCPLTPNTTALWRSTGQTRCLPCPANSNYNSGIKEKEEKDINPASPTYNTLRWVVDPSGTCPSPPDWVNGTSFCEQNPVTPFEYTGNQIINQQDINPCSPTYNQVRQISIPNTALCPVCSPACNAPSSKCINGVCVTGTWEVIKVVKIGKFGPWECTYAYCFHDGTVSNYSQTVTSSTACRMTCF
jgi:hypothetical protein